MSRESKYRGLHLGAEYNGDHGAAGPTMNELVQRFLRAGTLADRNYFPLLIEQVACFGDPNDFWYDDVSQVRATGTHSSIDIYRENVAQSAGTVVSLIEDIQPRVILVAGVHAYAEFLKQILPKLDAWIGDVVRTRNPSVQGHRRSVEDWVRCYRSFRATLQTGYIDDTRNLRLPQSRLAGSRASDAG